MENKKQLPISIIFIAAFFFIALTMVAQQHNFITNPILPGYFADPTIIKEGGTYYIYATIDPWGGDELAVFETNNFKNFTRQHINWPTKKHVPVPRQTTQRFGRLL